MSDIVEKGTTILTGKPFAFVLKSKYRTTHCDNCFKSKKLLKCLGCQYVYYCNSDCQKESWPIHEKECAGLKKILPKVLPDYDRFIARIIIKLNQGGANEVGYYTETNFRKFEDLKSRKYFPAFLKKDVKRTATRICDQHVYFWSIDFSDINVDQKRLKDIIEVREILLGFLDETLVPNMTECINIYGKMCINSYNILDNNLEIIGLGIYLGASIIDHSCKPTAEATFEGTTIFIRTLTNLPSLDWSQVRIPYVDLLDSNETRRRKLYQLYYFWCDCERCRQEEPTVEAAACPNSSCDSPCSIKADKCGKCNAQMSVEFKKTFEEIVDLTAKYLNYLYEVNDDLNNWKIIEMCLKKQKGVMHKFNIQHMRTVDCARVAALNLKYWEYAEIYSKELLPGFLLYFGEINFETGLLYLKMGNAQLNLIKPKEALETLNKANMVLMITHGNEHSLVREKLKPLLNQVMKYLLLYSMFVTPLDL